MSAIIGFLGTAVGILSFIQSNFPEKQDSGSTVAFAVGLDTDGLTNAGGDLPDVRVWDEAGTFLGAEYDPGSIQNGASGQEVHLSQSGYEFSQPTYALFTANDDAICIAYVSHTWADGNKWAWTGDWGAACAGGTYYHSNIIINPEEPHKPECLWIDANGDQPVTGFQVHFPDFTSGDGVSYNPDKNYYCDSPSYKYSFDNDPNTVSYFVPPREYNNYGAKRSAASRPLIRAPQSGNASENAPFKPIPDIGRVYSKDSRLVVSSDPQHTASSLCEADRSYGPDFVSVPEGLYCDMGTKTLYSLCGDGVAETCFDVETSQLVNTKGRIAPKKFSKVIGWD